MAFVNAGPDRGTEEIFVKRWMKSRIKGHQAKENRSGYFLKVDHFIIRKIKIGKIYSLFIHLSWVNKEDNSGGLISLSKCKTKLNNPLYLEIMLLQDLRKLKMNK